ncbi:MAG TPA: F0F1 ATP synthase subunit delta [Woeseiaceae bacterium]|jgi:F-type H+-transporting ATPase subunit delta|nr:F0F1 ATP synthase subunit delta [Woeseiaceae bacterium]
MADKHTLARPYAQAVFDLAREAGELAGWSDSLDIARQLTADGRVAKYLGNPGLSDEQRLEFLTGLFGKAAASLLDGGDEKGRNFLKLLIENGRVGVLPEIAERFDALRAEVENTVDVVVTSATALSEAQQQAIVAALTKKLGREVRLETRVDENLIGGAVIRAGDVVIDGSLRARLDGLTTALIN